MKPGEALNYDLNVAKASNVLWSINLERKEPDKETPPKPWNSLKSTHDKNPQQTEEWQTHGKISSPKQPQMIPDAVVQLPWVNWMQ